MLKNYWVIFFLFYCSCVFSQRIADFNLYQVGTSVLIKFNIKPGNSCNGFIVYHSIDSVNFNPVYEDPAICGISTVDEPKSNTHTAPVPDKVNYYRVQLPTIETSGIKRIYVPSSSRSGIIAYPNPVFNTIDSLKLRIYNTNNLQLIGFLYSPSGKPIKELNLRAVGDLTAIDISWLENGLYVIWLTDGYQAYASKFQVLR